MKAIHVNLKNENSEFDEFSDFLQYNDVEKVDYILENTDYIKNYIIDYLKTDTESIIDIDTVKGMTVEELQTNDKTASLSKEAISFLEEGISLSTKEDMEVYISPYIDVVDIPAFLIYDSETEIMEDDKFLIYINDDSLDVYMNQEFIQGIEDMRTPNTLIKLETVNEETPTYNIGYLKTQLLGDSEYMDGEYINKLEMFKKTMGFLLFRGRGIKLNNIISDKHIVMFDNETAEDMVFVYKLGNEWHIYGNNNKMSAFSSKSLSGVIDWLNSNHTSNNKLTSYNPKYNDNINKVKRGLYNQRIKYLNNWRNKKRNSGVKGSENKKPVVQMDKFSGYAIQTWPSASDASKALGVSRTSITKVANGIGATAGGFGWKFA